MSLVVHVAMLARQPLWLEGSLAPVELDPGREDEFVRLDRPVHYRLHVEKLAASVLVQGRLEFDLACQCVRCLRPFRRSVVLEPWSVLLDLEGEDRVPLVNDCVDLTPYLREDSLLALPQHPLCETECRGLPSGLESGEEVPTAARQPDAGVSAWAALDRLKL